MVDGGPPEKVGAGLLLMSDQGNGDTHILLLKRSLTSGNPGKWGLPGGNKDEEDDDLLATAVREATEEMTTVPAFTTKAEILTRRGKRLQKHYTVFLAHMTQPRESWVPRLNEEHTDYMWLSLKEALSRKDLHPVVARCLLEDPHRQTVFQAAGLGA
jgi:8-oxo-dGTP pyrophosphatase MutT (NUDIX family)